MASPVKFYTRQMYRKYKYFATWLPGVHLQLGDVGVMKRNLFTGLSSLGDFKIPFEVDDDPTPSDLDFRSSGPVNVTLKLAGTVVPGSSLSKNDVGFIVDFHGDKGFTFCANGVRFNSIKNKLALRNHIIELYKQGEWDKNSVVVTDLAVADSGTVIITMGKDGKIELKAHGNANLQKINLAALDAEFGTSFSRNIHTSDIAKAGMTPLFQVLRIKVNRAAIPTIKKSKMVFKGVSTLEFDPSDVLTPARANEELKDYLELEEVAFEEDEEEEEIA